MYQLYNLSVTGPGQFDSTMYIQGNTSVVGSLSVVSSVNLGDSLEVVGDTKLKSNLDVTNKSVVVNFRCNK